MDAYDLLWGLKLRTLFSLDMIILFLMKDVFKYLKEVICET